jgi:mannosyl-3-phosphoglycerate phosphatase
MRRLIFTDLDGTLLDFASYQPGPALPVLKRALADGDKVIFCSSKTLVEQRALMEEMDLRVPAIIENGSGLYLPPGNPWFAGQGEALDEGGRLLGWGLRVETIRAVLSAHEAASGRSFGGYAGMDDSHLAALCGLDVAAAGRARQRLFSETLTAAIAHQELDHLRAVLLAHGLECRSGGRFHTVSAVGVDKGAALRRVAAEVAAVTGNKWLAIALGDSANDFPMLAAADVALLLQQHNGSWATGADPAWQKIAAPGPQGWVKAIGCRPCGERQ